MTEDTFISHLMELRDRLLRTLIAVGVVFLCLFPFASDLYDLVAHPMMGALPPGAKMIATGVVTPFLIPVKVALMMAFALALPYVLYQAWAFVAPGLYAFLRVRGGVQLCLPHCACKRIGLTRH